MEVGGHLWSSLVQPWASLHRLSQVLRFEFLQNLSILILSTILMDFRRVWRDVL